MLVIELILESEMDIKQAKEKVAIIERLVEEIYNDKELEKLEPRYKIAAKWCDMDIECVSLD